MKKIIILSDHAYSNWLSVEEILTGLRKSYQLLEKRYSITYIDLPHNLKQFEYFEIAKEVCEICPDKIIFLDHLPVPGFLIKYINDINSDLRPDYYIHIYGNFSHEFEEWAITEKYIIGQKVKFIVASTRQKAFLDSLLKKNEISVCCHFPIETSKVSFNEAKRKSLRKKFNIRDDDFVFLYSGRITLQKNVVELCQEFIKAKRIYSIKNAKLFMVGKFDDFGADPLGVITPEGYYYSKWIDFKNSLSNKELKTIQYLGFYPKEDLLDLYSAVDCYASFSLHHDEDYGMAPRYALCTGCKVISTNWGGLGAIEKLYSGKDDWVNHIDVKHDTLGMHIDFQKGHEYFDKISKIEISTKERLDCGNRFKKNYSIENAQIIILNILLEKSQKFTGFGDLFKKISKKREDYPDKIIRCMETSKNSFHEEIYQSYISNKEEK